MLHAPCELYNMNCSCFLQKYRANVNITKQYALSCSYNNLIIYYQIMMKVGKTLMFLKFGQNSKLKYVKIPKNKVC